MRRPLLIIFIFMIITSFIYTSSSTQRHSNNNKVVIIAGTVLEKREKIKYNEYKLNSYLVRDYNRHRSIKVGDKIELKGTFKSLEEMEYDDFNYGRYIKSKGYKGLIYIKSYKRIGESTVYKHIENLKKYIVNTNRYLYKKNSDFINSIMVGKKEDLSKEENNMFSRTGTSHVIAISGLHTGLICGLIAFMLRGINKTYKLIIMAIIMFLYMAMVGTSPSIIRAIMSMIILYLAVFAERKRDGISTLSLIGIFFVTINPYIIYNVSFQLSFLSTLSIIYFYGYIYRSIKISLISLTLSANILILPIMYYNFKGLPIISVISNIIIVPFLGIIIYLSIINLILFKINITICKIVAYFNKVIIDTIYYLLEMLSDFKFAYIEIENPNIYFVVTYYIVVFSYMIYKELKVVKEQTNELQGYNK
ncbi:MAG: ComEC/Rec2 family competence protein [Peptostreptococcaceae bacterium]